MHFRIMAFLENIKDRNLKSARYNRGETRGSKMSISMLFLHKF
jgi:hypothetical protein